MLFLQFSKISIFPSFCFFFFKPSMVSRMFTRLCNHHHYLISDLFFFWFVDNAFVCWLVVPWYLQWAVGDPFTNKALHLKFSLGYKLYTYLWSLWSSSENDMMHYRACFAVETLRGDLRTKYLWRWYIRSCVSLLKLSSFATFYPSNIANICEAMYCGGSRCGSQDEVAAVWIGCQNECGQRLTRLTPTDFCYSHGTFSLWAPHLKPASMGFSTIRVFPI